MPRHPARPEGRGGGEGTCAQARPPGAPRPAFHHAARAEPGDRQMIRQRFLARVMRTAALLAGVTLAGHGALAQGRDLAAAGEAAPLAASVMPMGAGAVRVGGAIRFKAVSTADGWGYVYAIGASGRVTAWGEAIPLAAGQPVTLPLGARVARAVPPSGEETIVFVASRTRLNGFFGGRPLSAPVELAVTSWGFQLALAVELAGLPPGSAVRAETRVRVVD